MKRRPLFSLLTYSCLLVFISISINLQGQVFFTEDFNRGIPSSWTSLTLKGIADWDYTNQGPGRNGFPPLDGPSSNNGWAIVDSDTDCDYKAQNSWLVSPSIDGSDRERVFLIFESLYRKFDDKVFIRVGNNIADLESWSKIELFDDIGNNEYSHRHQFADEIHNPHNVVVDITPYAAGQRSFRFAFQFLSDKSTEKFGASGCAYFWQIDDIRLAELTNDLRVDEIRLPTNVSTPQSQISEMRFRAEIKNIGLVDQHDVKLKAIISDNAGILREITSAPIQTLNAGDSILVDISTGYLPTNRGTFYLDYMVEQSENDENPSSNNQRAKFQINTTTFAKDNGFYKSLTAPSLINGDFWEVGTYYLVPNSGDKAVAVEFAAGGAETPPGSGNFSHFGKEVTVYLYKVEEDDNDNFFNDSEAVPVGFGTFLYNEEENNTLISVPLTDLNSFEIGVPLEAGGQYFAMVELPKDMGISYTELPYFYDPSTIIKNGRWVLGGFSNTAITPIVRLVLENKTATSTQAELADHQIALYPNPVINNATIEFSLSQQSEIVNLSIKDMQGRLIGSKQLKKIKDGKVNWQLGHLVNGAYQLHINTEEGDKTIPFTIQH